MLLEKKEMKDITDKNVYKNWIENESEPFITLTLNVERIQANKESDQSPSLFYSLSTKFIETSDILLEIP